jgi:hypothetical protein
MSTHSHPYLRLTGTPQWTAIDRAVCELAESKDLVEATAHDYIVGYLCQALEATRGAGAERAHATPICEPAARADALRRLRATVKEANPTNRNLVAELLQERRIEAQSE